MRRVLVVMVVCSGGVGTWAADTNIDYMAKLNELVTRGGDENLNAAPLYEQAFNSYVKLPTLVDGKDIRHWPTELPAEKRRALADWVRSNADALDRLRQGTRRPSYWFQYRGGHGIPECWRGRPSCPDARVVLGPDPPRQIEGR